MVECFDDLARITPNELATTRSVISGTPQECLFYKIKSGCRFGEKCSYTHRQIDENLVERLKNDDTSAVVMLKKID